MNGYIQLKVRYNNTNQWMKKTVDFFHYSFTPLCATRGKMDYEIVERIPSVDEYRVLRKSVGWREHSPEVIEQSLSHSLFSVCAVSEDKTIGFGRLIGDGHMYFYLQDVMVLPQCQGLGIGSKITETIKNYVNSIAKPGAFWGLMATESASGLYEKFGFETRPENMSGMGIRIGA